MALHRLAQVLRIAAYGQRQIHRFLRVDHAVYELVFGIQFLARRVHVRLHRIQLRLRFGAHAAFQAPAPE